MFEAEVLTELQNLTGIDLTSFFANNPIFLNPVLPMLRCITRNEYWQFVRDLVGDATLKETLPCNCRAQWLCVRGEEHGENAGWQVYVDVPTPKHLLNSLHTVIRRVHCNADMVPVTRCIIMECEACHLQVLQVRPALHPNKQGYYVEHLVSGVGCLVCGTYIPMEV